MTALRIALYDDDPEFLRQMMQDVEKATADHNVSVEKIEAITEQDVAALRNRQQAFRDGQDPDFENQLIFDRSDLFIVDYDLQSKLGASATGEGLAYLARSFSTCGPIVEVNQYGRRPRFDLRLVPEDDSWAELNVAEEDLRRPGLWDADKTCSPGEFRPWQWPLLPRLIEDFRACVNQARSANKDESPSHLIGYDSAEHGPLPDRAIDFFEGPSLFEAVGRQLEPRDQGDDEQAAMERLPEPIRASIIASRVRFWAEHLILPTEARIIDLPHLALAFPQIVPEGDGGALNATARLDAGFNPEEVAEIGEIGAMRLPDEHWISRPGWFLEPIIDKDILAQDDEERPSVVFLEDSSCFAEADQATAFRANAPGTQANRYILRHDPVDYEPSNRLRG